MDSLTTRSSMLAISHRPPGLIGQLIKCFCKRRVDVIASSDVSTSSGAVSILENNGDVHTIIDIGIGKNNFGSMFRPMDLIPPGSGCRAAVNRCGVGQSINASTSDSIQYFEIPLLFDVSDKTIKATEVAVDLNPDTRHD
nr:MAG TPA: hypothetical protein [Caudoviricetes sp.]